MNPCDPTTTSGDSEVTRAQSNPAKAILYVIGILGLMQGFVAMPVGLFVGPHILGAAVAMLGFGSTAIWLGHRRYDPFGRYATITWGVLAILLVLVATALQPPTTNDVAGIVVISLLLLMFGAVLLIAVWRRVERIAS